MAKEPAEIIIWLIMVNFAIQIGIEIGTYQTGTGVELSQNLQSYAEGESIIQEQMNKQTSITRAEGISVTNEATAMNTAAMTLSLMIIALKAFVPLPIGLNAFASGWESMAFFAILIFRSMSAYIGGVSIYRLVTGK